MKYRRTWCTVLIFLIISSGVQMILLPTEVVSQYDLLPWVGLLRYAMGGKQGYTGIVLISPQHAVGVGSELAAIDHHTLRTRCVARFYAARYVAVRRGVLAVTLHPRHGLDTQHTPAVLLLQQTNASHTPRPVRLIDHAGPRYKYIYRLGYTDDHGVFEQVAHRVEAVPPAQCRAFYVQEQLNQRSMWPEQWSCFRDRSRSHSCLNEVGMALATKDDHHWTLLGLSIVGPSCAHPSRYIELRPYVAWLVQAMHSNARRWRGIGIDPVPVGHDNLNQNHYEDWDTVYLNKLSDGSIVIRPLTEPKIMKFGECSSEGGEARYREVGNYSTPQPANGLYMLSHLDTLFRDYHCVMVKYTGAGMSKGSFWLDFGLHQSNEMEQFVKAMPFRVRGKKPPVRVMPAYDSWSRFKDMRSAHLLFYFRIDPTAQLEVSFFAVSQSTGPSAGRETSPWRRPGMLRKLGTRWKPWWR